MSYKYDWVNVPACVRFISTDWEGWKLYHTTKPQRCDLTDCFSSAEPDGYTDYHLIFPPDDNEYKGDWEDSLEQQPKEFGG